MKVNKKEKYIINERLFEILLLIGILVILLFLLTQLYINKNKNKFQQTSVNLLKDTEKCLLILPLEIKDSIYYFLWDTGCHESYIDADLIKELNLNVHRRAFYSNIIRVDEIVADTFNISEVTINIGDIIHSTYFHHNNNNAFKRFKSLDSRVRGVIGQNIISSFYWLFDIAEYKVTVSKKEISIEYDKTKDLTLSYYKDSDNCIMTDLRIDELKENKFFFDTGYSPSLSLLGFKILPSFILHYDEAYHTKKYVMSVHDAKINYAYLLRDSILINDKELYNISLISEETFHKTNYITVNFVYQFEKMYYDPVNKEIKLMGFRNEENSLDDEKEAIEYLKAEEKKHMNGSLAH